MDSLFLNQLNIHSDWQPFLSKEILDLITQIELEITKKEYTPSSEKALRFFELPLHSIKIIILGQDPYPQPGVATGRAFEVGTLKSWNEPFKNVSLKNILRTLYKAYSGKAISYTELKGKLDNEFPVLSPNKLFKHWEKQGVLLLNTSFTCEPGSPGSHKKLWTEFSSQLLRFINGQLKKSTWFLWGNHAKEATAGLTIKNKIISQHPMMCYARENRKSDFLYGEINCFEPFIDKIDWTGYGLQSGIKTSGILF